VGAGGVGEGRPVAGTAGATPPEAAGTFAFAGRAFKDQTQAERVFQTTDSNLRATQKQLAELNKRVERAEAAAGNAVTALERMIAERAAGGQGGAVAAQQTASPAAPEAPWYEDGELLDFYRDLFENQGPDVAMMHLLGKVDSVVNERVKAALEQANQAAEQRYAPLVQEHQVGTMFRGAMGHFYDVAEEADAGGNPLYPELSQNQDTDVHREIVALWREIDPKLTLGTRGVRQAVFEYRSGYRANGERVEPSAGPSYAAPAGGAPSAARVVRALEARDAAGAEVLTGTGTPRPAAPGSDIQEARLKTALRQAGRTVRSRDGFDYGFAPD
jgi:hypothetical protein